MSHKASAWAVEQRVGDPTAKLLLLTLAESASIDEAECWPSIGTLARRVEASEATVKRKLKDLTAAGLLEVNVRTRPNGSSSSNMYRLIMTGGGAQIEPLPGGGGAQVEPPGGVKALNPGGGQSSEPPVMVKGSRQKEEKPAVPAGDHKRFVEEWVKAYEETFGDSYAFQGGKDGAAAKWLLTSSGLDVDGVINLAKLAWSQPDTSKTFNCRRAITISGLRSGWNEIRSELRARGALQAATRETTTTTEVRDGL